MEGYLLSCPELIIKPACLLAACLASEEINHRPITVRFYPIPTLFVFLVYCFDDCCDFFRKYTDSQIRIGG
jgi:hypothetical protein